MFNNIYKNKKVLVTGHTGFKGSWLTYWLNYLGAEVIGYSKEYPSYPNLSQILEDDVANKVTNVVGDVCDLAMLSDVIIRYKPDIIFHLAAQALVRKSYRDPLQTFHTNVFGVINLLEAVRIAGYPRSIVNVTTDKCYENINQSYSYKETDPLGGYDPYSSSKACSEIVTSCYRRSFLNENGILVATARAGNVIGGGDWAEERLIPDIVIATSKHKSLTIRNPNSVRPWQFVLEPLSGYLLLGQKLLEGDKSASCAWNFGPDYQSLFTVKNVVSLMAEYWPEIVPDYSESHITSMHEAEQLQLDCTQAQTILDWHPVWDMQKTVKNTVVWYKKYYQDNTDVVNTTREQLEEYLSDAKAKKLIWAD